MLFGSPGDVDRLVGDALFDLQVMFKSPWQNYERNENRTAGLPVVWLAGCLAGQAERIAACLAAVPTQCTYHHAI